MHSHTKFRMITALITVCLFGITVAAPAEAFTNPAKYPRTGNYYLRAGTDITPEITQSLARYDLLVLPAEVQIQNPTLIPQLRAKHPDIVILAYFPTLSYNFRYWNDDLHKKLLSGIQSDWWLKDSAGAPVSVWPGTQALNLSSGWATYLPQFTHDNILSTGLWDGVFFDEVDACISCRNNGDVDTDNNRFRDDGAAADRAWRAGYANLFQTARNLEGTGRIIIINGSSTPEYQPSVNGRMFESFPTPWEGSGRWQDTISNYKNLEQIVGVKPSIFFIDGDSSNTGVTTDYRDMRFGMTSTLLGGGYFGYDFGANDHGQLWWYDEYDAFLGQPESQPLDVKTPTNTTITPSVWRRDFEKGIVLVNATGTNQSINLHDDFEKLHGTQDTITNDGSIVSQVTVPASDGLILLRLSDRILGTPFPNGAFSRIFKSDGSVARTGFFLYDARFNGGSTTLLSDFDHDGATEAITAGRGRIEIWNQNGIRRLTFAPYGNTYLGPINISVGDVDGDSVLEIVTGAGAGGGPHVRVFRMDGKPVGTGFFAYDKNFRGGVNVAAGDLDGDGKAEIVTGSGFGGGPQVRVFRADGSVVVNGFFAYATTFRGGVNVAAGDLDGDGKAEIVTGAGRTGGPHVRIFNGSGTSLGKGFFAYDINRRDGVLVGISDLDGDGKAEILALTTSISQ